MRSEERKKVESWVTLGVIGLLALSYVWGGDSGAQENPQYGGTLTFAVAEEPPETLPPV